MRNSGRDKPSARNHLTMQVASKVVREIRQHAHSSSKAEICGVLLGNQAEGMTSITAAIAGANADQGGAHVTFTQETWAHIYQIKDRDYPDHRILGWYHSHPGFGVFLSEHDTFIHRNFFSDPHQIAWVYDPHSDEEGCFGWSGARIERLRGFTVIDDQGGELADETGRPEPVFDDGFQGISVADGELEAGSAPPSGGRRREQILAKVLSHAVALILGVLFAWYVIPRVVLVPIPVDPQTGVPLKMPAGAGSADFQKGGPSNAR